MGLIGAGRAENEENGSKGARRMRRMAPRAGCDREGEWLQGWAVTEVVRSSAPMVGSELNSRCTAKRRPGGVPPEGRGVSD